MDKNHGDVKLIHMLILIVVKREKTTNSIGTTYWREGLEVINPLGLHEDMSNKVSFMARNHAIWIICKGKF